MPTITMYDYLAFALPGGVVVFASIYGSAGWQRAEPGAVFGIGLVAIAFIVGHAVGALASWGQAVYWGHLPGSRLDPCWGLFGKGRRYSDEEKIAIEAEFKSRFGEAPWSELYNLGYTLLQELGKTDRLDIFNSQIAFYRNMGTATIIALIAVLVQFFAKQNYLPPPVYLPVLLVVSVLFIYRYKYFWRVFGDNVIRGVRALPPPA